MKTYKMIAALLAFTLILGTNAFGGSTHSGRALTELGNASAHAIAGSGHAVVGSGQAISAVASVPFAVVGSVGVVSAEIAKDLRAAATAPIGTPLAITDDAVTVGPPPNEVLVPLKVITD